jgi:hypothetical protein
MRSYQTFSGSGYTIPHSHQQAVRDPQDSLHPHQHLALSTGFYFGHSVYWHFGNFKPHEEPVRQCMREQRLMLLAQKKTASWQDLFLNNLQGYSAGIAVLYPDDLRGT